MAAVFISYSRKDIAFVRRLHAALGAQGREAWVDWEGIPPTASWMKEIVTAIDSAAAFVFVMTPDSLASPVCQRELAHAVAQNKRLIPIACVDMAAASVPESLATLNWIFFRDRDDFAAALKTLLTAIDTDLPWVQAHTRLLVRAREWDARGREHSLGLRGKDLKSAEEWLTLGPSRQPKPTELQTVYVLESRRVATSRRYILLGAAMTGLVAVAILSTIAYFERREAARQQTIATARRLTSDAELGRDQHATLPRDTGWTERSALLATEAALQLEAAGVSSVQTDIAMRRGLAALPRRLARLERYSISLVDALAFTGTGRLVAASRSPLQIERWTIAGDSVVHESKDVPGGVASAVFSPDGKFLATAAFNDVPGRIDVWDVATLEPIATFSGGPGTVAALALGPGAGALAATFETFDSRTKKWNKGFTRLWDVRGSGQPETARLGGAARNLAFSPDGAWLAGTVDSVPRAWKMTSATGAGIREVPLSSVADATAASLAFTPDGKQLVVGFDGTLRTWSVDDWKIARELEVDRPPIAASADGEYVAVMSDNYTARIVSTAENAEVARLHGEDQIRAVAVYVHSLGGGE